MEAIGLRGKLEIPNTKHEKKLKILNLRSCFSPAQPPARPDHSRKKLSSRVPQRGGRFRQEIQSTGNKTAIAEAAADRKHGVTREEPFRPSTLARIPA